MRVLNVCLPNLFACSVCSVYVVCECAYGAKYVLCACVVLQCVVGVCNCV